jgi:hypothetical protein
VREGDTTLTSSAEEGRLARVVRWLPPIGWILLGGLALRLLIAYVLLPDEWHAADLRLFTYWAEVLVEHGPGAFFASAILEDPPPGYLIVLYILWLLGSIGGIAAGVAGVAPAEAVTAMLKLPSIAADIAIAGLLYGAASRFVDKRAGAFAAALFLFIPVTWYVSALWGQVEAIGSLLLLASILLLIRGSSEAATAAAVLAAATKPQFAIVLLVVGVVLLRRHLFVAWTASPPERSLQPTLVDRLASWMRSSQGPLRLVTSAAAALGALIVVLLPFDIQSHAPTDVADVPLVGHLAGLLELVGWRAGQYSALTGNAFNPWALVGDNPLSRALTGQFHWTFDSVHVVAGLSAAQIGFGLFGAVALVVSAGLLRHDDRRTIVLAITLLAVAFFVLPTRVHERHLYPVFVVGALLVAMAPGFRWWYVALGLANAANLHAIFTMPWVSHGQAAQQLPLGELLRQEWAVAAIAVAHAGLLAWVFVRFVQSIRWRTLSAELRGLAERNLARVRASLAPGLQGIGLKGLGLQGIGLRRLHWAIAGGLLLLLATLLVQLNGLTDRPPGYYIDESSFSYNAWTLAQAGVDAHGRAWPLFFEAFGEWKTWPYIYLLAGVFSLTGPSIEAARFVSAAAGVVTVAMLALLALRVTRRPEAAGPPRSGPARRRAPPAPGRSRAARRRGAHRARLACLRRRPRTSRGRRL